MTYYDWLCKKVASENEKLQYANVLYTLHKLGYYYSLPLDANRKEDALALRNHFRENYTNEDVSVLEVLVALSERCADEVVSSIDYDEHDVFFAIIELIGIDEHSTENYIRQCIEEFLDDGSSTMWEKANELLWNKFCDNEMTDIY